MSLEYNLEQNVECGENKYTCRFPKLGDKNPAPVNPTLPRFIKTKSLQLNHNAPEEDSQTRLLSAE